MLPSSPIETMDVYASNSQYINGPSPEQQAAGTVPLDTLPADWWNWLWKQITERINQASAGMEAIYDEVMSVLTAASIEPSQLQSDQLLNAIKALASVTGTSSVAGAVKSSADSGKVSIDKNGTMTVNGLGIPSALNTTVKNIVGAINEILLNYTNNKATTDASIEELQNGKAPTNHASEETTYGAGTASTYGHVKLSDSYTTETPKSASESVGASQKALHEAYAELKASSLVIPTGLIFPFAGPDTKVPTGYLLCNGQQVSKENYAALYAVIGATYNRPTDGEDSQLTVFRVPDLRESVPVGIGKRDTGVTTHDPLELGQFRDDAIQQHEHGLNNHTHSFTPSGTLDAQGSHSHNTDSQSDSTTSGMSANSWGSVVSTHEGLFNGRALRSSGNITLSGSISWAGGDNSGGNHPSAMTIDVQHTHSFSHTHKISYAGGHSHTFTGTAGTTGGSTANTTAVGGTTTHGKNLGVNYIIKT